MLFDIIIPTYNNLEELKKCLSSLENQTIKDFHVWVCIDGSTDSTINYLESSIYKFPFSILQHEDYKNHGRSATRNLALYKITAKYIAFLDSDLTVENDYLEKHLAILNNNNSISLGRLIYTDTNNIWTNYTQTRGKAKYTHLQTIDFKYLETGNACMPAHFFTETNGFDENISGYGGEDTELAYRIHQKFPKSQTIYNANAITKGSLNKPLETALQQRKEFASTNLKYIVSIHPDYTNIFNYRFLIQTKATWLYKLCNMFSIQSQSLVKNEKILASLPFRNTIIHLLVFKYMYEGVHNNI